MAPASSRGCCVVMEQKYLRRMPVGSDRCQSNLSCPQVYLLRKHHPSVQKYLVQLLSHLNRYRKLSAISASPFPARASCEDELKQPRCSLTLSYSEGSSSPGLWLRRSECAGRVLQRNLGEQGTGKHDFLLPYLHPEPLSPRMQVEWQGKRAWHSQRFL